ncbi:hypothetical protein SAMN05444722_1870 [Rhodovulum sp. ES.010]|uniref:sel1 repeat family protein n=1 Tax=Rhodovulum sp. ES.010 TaxID=1882821 RepID=UPI00092AF79D|nr:sel1 repeat family protein [Rhodovulum sp. ES.010]SIO39613.1 hypothetical protein SAMN05444722_1870 [Rhodovulum sp. ES.010]
MSSKEAKEDRSSEFKGCLVCKHGRFVDDLPLFGECRCNPPRPKIDRNNEVAGRIFPHVRFDDWCGRLQVKTSRRTEAQLKKVIPHLSREHMCSEAKRLLNEGDHLLAIKFFESIYGGGEITVHMMGRISKTLHDLMLKNQGDADLRSLFVTWLRRAADMGHPGACILYAQVLVDKEYSLLDEGLSEKYLRQAADLGDEDAKRRIEMGSLYRIDAKSLPEIR